MTLTGNLVSERPSFSLGLENEKKEARFRYLSNYQLYYATNFIFTVRHKQPTSRFKAHRLVLPMYSLT